MESSKTISCTDSGHRPYCFCNLGWPDWKQLRWTRMTCLLNFGRSGVNRIWLVVINVSFHRHLRLDARTTGDMHLTTPTSQRFIQLLIIWAKLGSRHRCPPSALNFCGIHRHHALYNGILCWRGLSGKRSTGLNWSCRRLLNETTGRLQQLDRASTSIWRRLCLHQPTGRAPRYHHGARMGVGQGQGPLYKALPDYKHTFGLEIRHHMYVRLDSSVAAIWVEHRERGSGEKPGSNPEGWASGRPACETRRIELYLGSQREKLPPR